MFGQNATYIVFSKSPQIFAREIEHGPQPGNTRRSPVYRSLPQNRLASADQSVCPAQILPFQILASIVLAERLARSLLARRRRRRWASDECWRAVRWGCQRYGLWTMMLPVDAPEGHGPAPRAGPCRGGVYTLHGCVRWRPV